MPLKQMQIIRNLVILATLVKLSGSIIWSKKLQLNIHFVFMTDRVIALLK